MTSIFVPITPNKEDATNRSAWLRRASTVRFRRPQLTIATMVRRSIRRSSRDRASIVGPPQDPRFKSFDVRTVRQPVDVFSSDSSDESYYESESDEGDYSLLDKMCAGFGGSTLSLYGSEPPRQRDNAVKIWSDKPDQRPLKKKNAVVRSRVRDISDDLRPRAPPRSESNISCMHSSSPRHIKRQTKIIEKLKSPKQSSAKGRSSVNNVNPRVGRRMAQQKKIESRQDDSESQATDDFHRHADDRPERRKSAKKKMISRNK